MEKKKIEKEIISLIQEIKGNSDLCIEEDTNLADDIGLDSLELINLILEIEEKYDVEIDLDEFDFDYLESFKRFVDFFINSLGQ